MVGVPRSTGCRLCVKRRVRCDETRPACRNCVRYGAECPGYVRALKFVSEKHDIQRGPTARAASRRKSTPSPPAQLSPGSKTTLAPLVEDLLSKRNEVELFHFLAWFRGLPDRVGSKVTLDSAVLAFTLHLRGKESGDEALVARARSSYVNSLSALQAALNHPREWSSSETLCSAMLLCLYESFAGTTSHESWMAHASGVGRLMQVRGAAAHDTEWDVALVSGFRGLMVMHALFTRQDCFLAKSEWRNLWADRRDPFSVLVDEFWDCYALCPRVVRRAHELRTRSGDGNQADVDATLALVKEAEDLRNRLVAWHEVVVQYLPSPHEVAATDPESLYPTGLTYTSVWLGTLYMGYWASLLIMQSTLASCDYPASFPQSNQELVANILKSVECTSKGIMGPYRIGYSLWIASEFAGAPERDWITRVLGRSSSLFAATTPS